MRLAHGTTLSPTPAHEFASSRVIATPLGPMRARTAGGALVALEFVDHDPTEPSEEHGDSHESRRALDQIQEELARYFAGELRQFLTPIAPDGSGFQGRVWAALTRIPFGEAWSYARLARAAFPGHHRPCSLARAVGQANHRNPIAIVVPCHRVIASDGTLCGYAGGLDRKRTLLELEGAGLFRGA